MYLVFVGTTDYLTELKEYLKTVNHTLLEGTSAWFGTQLQAQVVIMFTQVEALELRAFLKNTCKQREVPIAQLATTFIEE